MTVQSQAETPIAIPRIANPLNPSARRVLVSVNPRAGSRAGHEIVAAIVNSLEKSAFRVDTFTDLGQLRAVATEELANGDLRAVVAIGGDGTAHVVRNHTPLELPLLIVPKGTENLLGRYVRQGTAPEDVSAVLKNGVVVDLDLGLAGSKYFLLMISAGFDAEVIRHLHKNRRGNISHISYLIPALNAIRRYGYPPIRVYWHEQLGSEQALTCRWMFGFNMPLYALGLPIAPAAVATDGVLDVCTFDRGAVWSVARYLWHVMRRMHLRLPDARLQQSIGFRLEPEDGAEIPYQLDGEYAGELPVDVSVLPGRLRLVVSAETATRLGFAVPSNP